MFKAIFSEAHWLKNTISAIKDMTDVIDFQFDNNELSFQAISNDRTLLVFVYYQDI